MKTKQKIIITFWVLWALFVASTFLFGNLTENYGLLVLWLSIIAYAVFPIIGLILLAIFNKGKPVKKQITETERRVEKEKELKEKMMAEEKDRKEIEKYKVKKIGKWFIAPLLAFFIFGIWFVWDWHANGQINWYLFWIVALCLVPLFATDVETKWGKRLQCKRELFKSDEKYSTSRYSSDYIYTDEPQEYYLYKTAKIISVLMSVLEILGVIFIGFIWLGSISIAPTTIIIILLVMILLK